MVIHSAVWTEKWCHCWENFWVNTDRIQNTTNQCYCQYLSLCLNTYMVFFWSDCFKWSIVDSFLQKIATNVKYDNFFLGMHETTLFRKKRFEINFFVRGNASKFAIFIDINQGIHMWKHKVALNEKRKKLCGFSLSINIANFEAFCWTKKMISNLFFLKSVVIIPSLNHLNYLIIEVNLVDI